MVDRTKGKVILSDLKSGKRKLIELIIIFKKGNI